METNGKAIVAEQLTKRFGEFTAVDAISFEVNRGEIFGFLGANGAGKTTAMRMLCGLSKPTSGKARVAGFDVFRQTANVTGLIMTKLDGTARGGVLVAAAERFGLPIHAIGVGEGVGDLRPFDPRAVARAIAGLAP